MRTATATATSESSQSQLYGCNIIHVDMTRVSNVSNVSNQPLFPHLISIKTYGTRKALTATNHISSQRSHYLLPLLPKRFSATYYYLCVCFLLGLFCALRFGFSFCFVWLQLSYRLLHAAVVVVLGYSGAHYHPFGLLAVALLQL